MRFFFCVVGTLFLVSACSPHDTPPSCPGPHPAFRLQITPEDGKSLPEGTSLTVHYGGNGEESFRLGTPAQPQVLFCEASRREEEDGVSSLACELWTDGAANVKIEAEGFQTYEEQLAATTNNCGIQTTLMEIQLKTNAGAGGSS